MTFLRFLRKPAVIVFIATALLSALLVPKLLYINDAGDLVTEVLNAWGDLGWHVANITSFAYGENFPPENPIYAGHSLSYPFFISLLSAGLLKLGLSLSSSIIWPALIGIPVFFTLYWLLAKRLTGSSLAAAIALLLLLFSGSTFGFLQLGQDVAYLTGNGGNEAGWQFLNIILAGLLPQRSMLLGLPMALGILLSLLNRRYWLAGILAGLLPLAHSHSVLALIPAIIGIFWIQAGGGGENRRQVIQGWGMFAGLALLISLPQIFYLLQGNGASFISFSPGWMAEPGLVPWLIFWFKNTGLLIPVGVAVLFIPLPKTLKAITMAGYALFAAANLFSFAPWAWDNWKLLIWWLMLTLPAVGYILARLRAYKQFGFVVIAAFVLLHSFSAAYDIRQLALPQTKAYEEWDAEAQEFAEQVRQATEPSDVILTAPYHNNPIALTGRKIYLGFPGHIWSHGLPYQPRLNAVTDFYNGHVSKLPEIDAQYVVVGPVEHQQFPNLKIQPIWQLVTSTKNYQLYKK